jgi:hypothetical protein
MFDNNNFHNRKSKNFKSITSSDESRVANPMPRIENNFPYLLIMSFFFQTIIINQHIHKKWKKLSPFLKKKIKEKFDPNKEKNIWKKYFNMYTFLYLLSKRTKIRPPNIHSWISHWWLAVAHDNYDQKLE